MSQKKVERGERNFSRIESLSPPNTFLSPTTSISRLRWPTEGLYPSVATASLLPCSIPLHLLYFGLFTSSLLLYLWSSSGYITVGSGEETGVWVCIQTPGSEGEFVFGLRSVGGAVLMVDLGFGLK